MAHEHSYSARTVWTGARHGAMSSYDSYSREYTALCEGKPELVGSADAAFRGDASKHNPEDLLLISLSACHLLSYLAECARVGIAVVDYEDEASGTMAIKDGRMRFTEVTLKPRVVVAAGSDLVKARSLHERAHAGCFIANSVAFPVINEPIIFEEGAEGAVERTL
ncbi:MAG TPA: OsmC family protein [Capsulimonadaceae bacterium]|nr:OsmC family protein [Capsulimonadaceae bacterium]